MSHSSDTRRPSSVAGGEQAISYGPANGASSVLRALLGDDGERAFRDGHWPERAWTQHRPIDALPAVLRAEELASLDAIAARFRGPVAFGRGAQNTRTFQSDAHPLHVFELGFTVYLYDVAGCIPGLPGWLAALERELGIEPRSARVGAFASPQGDGLPNHFDADDVISIQLSGVKTFEIEPVETLRYPVGQQYGPGMVPDADLYAQASVGFPVPPRSGVETIRMEPGSVLFLPRGTWHTTRAETDSFSISIGMRPRPAVDLVLEQLRAVLLQDSRWRRPAYGLHGDAQARAGALAELDTLLGLLPAQLAELSAPTLFPLTADARLSTPSNVIDLTRVRRFQRIPTSTLKTETVSPTRVRLSTTAWDASWIERPTLRTEVPASLAPVLEWLTHHPAAFASDTLAGRFGQVRAVDIAQLLDLLERAGYLHELTFPVLSHRAA